MTASPTPVLTDLSFLEGPRWHDGRVWVSDFYTHRVLSAKEDGSDLRVEAEVPTQPSGLGWLPDGRLLIVSMRDRKLLRREQDGTLVTHAELDGVLKDKLNDMVVDSQGRAYVGSFGFDLMGGAALDTSAIARVDPDGSVQLVADGLFFPNGMVLTDGLLRVAESFGNRISSFDVAADGSLGQRRTWAKFGPEPTPGTAIEQVMEQLVIVPDGCSGVEDGSMWAADAGGGGRAVRVREGGEIVEEVAVPDSGIFACALGGADGRTLFLCAAPDFHEEARSAAREASLLAHRVALRHGGLP